MGKELADGRAHGNECAEEDREGEGNEGRGERQNERAPIISFQSGGGKPRLADGGRPSSIVPSFPSPSLSPRPPARSPPPVLPHAPVPVLTPSLVRRRPRGHLAVSQGVRQLVQHVTTAKADGPPLLSYSPHPPLPSTGDGKGQRKAASAAACQSSSIGRGRRGSVGRRGASEGDGCGRRQGQRWRSG